MTLSIVVPSLNQGRFIGRTLDSLTGQKGIRPGELEIIVIDGGSSDRSVAEIRRVEHRLDYWVSEPDGGQTDALIKGFRRARGDLLGWLCADDLLHEYTVREVLDAFREERGRDFIYGDTEWIDADGRRLRPRKEIPFNWFIWVNDHNYIPQPAAFWRRDLYDRVGGLDPAFDVAMDADLFSRFAQCTQPVHLSRCWATVRWYPEQKSRRLRERGDEESRLIRQRLGRLPGNPVSAAAKFCAAKALRVSWKLATGAYW